MGLRCTEQGFSPVWINLGNFAWLSHHQQSIFIQCLTCIQLKFSTWKSLAKRLNYLLCGWGHHNRGCTTRSQWAGKGLEMAASPINLHLWQHSSPCFPTLPNTPHSSLLTPHYSLLTPYPTQYPDALQCESSLSLNCIVCKGQANCYLLFAQFGILNIFIPIFWKLIQLNSSLQIDTLRTFASGILWNNSSSSFVSSLGWQIQYQPSF